MVCIIKLISMHVLPRSGYEESTHDNDIRKRLNVTTYASKVYLTQYWLSDRSLSVNNSIAGSPVWRALLYSLIHLLQNTQYCSTQPVLIPLAMPTLPKFRQPNLFRLLTLAIALHSTSCIAEYCFCLVTIHWEILARLSKTLWGTVILECDSIQS